MTVDEILEVLAVRTDVFPYEAVQAAITRKKIIAPRLMEKFEAIAADPIELAQATTSFYPITYLYLLAGFSEKKAFPTVLKVLSLPGDTPAKLFHHVIEDSLVPILR